ncbi:MAG: hypothetical protein V1708_02395 [Candidatus Micrarchaeota archaeon]
MRFIAFAACALCLLGLLGHVAAYSDYSYSALAQVNGDGTAKITEKSVFLFETDNERTEFENNLNLGESTISQWQKFSKNVKFHFRGGIGNVRITAKKEFTVGFNAGTVIIEYDIGTPIFNATKEGSRKTVYTLEPEALGFEVTSARETVLGSNMQLSFELPRDSEIIKIAPLPDTTKERTLSWNGPIARKWELQYSREIPLSQEVSEFFTQSYGEALAFLPLIVLAGLALIVAFILIKFKHK